MNLNGYEVNADIEVQVVDFIKKSSGFTSVDLTKYLIDLGVPKSIVSESWAAHGVHAERLIASRVADRFLAKFKKKKIIRFVALDSDGKAFKKWLKFDPK